MGFPSFRSHHPLHDTPLPQDPQIPWDSLSDECQYGGHLEKEAALCTLIDY